MKKFFVPCCLFLASSAIAATVCVEDDVVAVVLDGSQTTSTYTNSPLSDQNGTGDWTVTFAYGTVYGVSSCLASSATYTPAVSSLTQGATTGKIVVNNATVVGGESTGGYCWCKMVHPFESRWVFWGSRSANSCKANCAYNCAQGARSIGTMRTSMFTII